ncbi:unnamed protein product, partial [Litomosoides sigmodontis]
MSIKLMKQRWIVEKVDEKKDSTEIVDMDVDEKDEYEIISEMEKPSNFLTQRDVENEEPQTIEINMHNQGNVASLEVKKPSRWDVGAPFCIQLNDALTSNANEAEACNGTYNKSTGENEREISANEATVSKITTTKMEEYPSQNSNGVDLSLDKITLPCDPCDIALPPNPSELSDNASRALLSHSVEDNLSSEATLDKGKIIIKWKLMKTPKEFAGGDVKIWEPEVESRELPKLYLNEQQKSTLKHSETLDKGAVAESLDSGTDQSSSYTKSLIQRDQSDCVVHEMQFLDNQCIKQKAVLQETGSEQATSNEGLSLNCSYISEMEMVLSCSKLHYDQDLKRNSVSLDNETATTAEASDQRASCAMHFPQEVLLKGERVSSQSTSLIQQQWKVNANETETNWEGKQESSLTSLPSATSIFMYSCSSKTLPSLDRGHLQTTEGRKQIPENADSIFADSTSSVNEESVVREAALAPMENERELDVSTAQISSVQLKLTSQPAQYEHLDENIILCDESLIKEAKVVRCFCEPTSTEIAEGRGCSSGCINRELYTECGSRCPSGVGCANRRFHNKQYAKVEVFNAGVKGWGLRAAEPLEPGRFIIEYVGEVIDAEEMIRRGRRYGKDPKHVHHYLMALKNGAVIDATAKGNVSRFINHSCDPNCESQKWAVDRQLRVGFFVIKPIAVGEEIVFDYQLERYGRKAQRCFCGAANCRGRIGDNSESEEGEDDKISDEAEVEDSETDDGIPLAKLKLKSEKKEKSSRIAKKKKRQPSLQRCNKAIVNALSRGPPRNRTQVRDLVRLMIQVEQAPQRSSLIQCIRFAHPDVLRLFIQESGLRLLYVFLATDYPIDDEQSVLKLQIKSLDLLDVMPIVNKNQVVDSHLASTVEKIADKRGPVDEVVEDVVRRLISAVCCDIPSTSNYSALTLSRDPDPMIESLHYEMVSKAAKLMAK